MTIIQASICASNKAIILIGDRLVTVSEIYEAEAKSQKLYAFGFFGIGFAGTLSDIISVKDTIPENPPTFPNFIESISKIYNQENETREDSFFKRHSLLDKQEFKEYVQHDEGKIPEDLIEWIYANLQEIRLECIAVAVGFNEKKEPQIVFINQFGDQFNQTESNHCAIGSGETFSDVFFDVNEYDPCCTLDQGLFFAFRAKKSAEAHIGVGQNTDILIIELNKDPVFILNESAEMRKLEEIYNNERVNIYDLYNDSAQKVKGIIDEIRQ